MLCDCHSVTKEAVVIFKILSIIYRDAEFLKKKNGFFCVRIILTMLQTSPLP